MEPPNAHRSPAAKPPRKSGFSALRGLNEDAIFGAAVVGLSGILMAIFAEGAGKWNALTIAIAAAAYYGATGLRAMRGWSASPALSEAFNLARSGKLAEAEARIATLDGDSSRPTRLLVDLARAEIAMRRGDLVEARRLLDRVIEIAGDGRATGPHASNASEAHGLRAWARAATGDLEGAMEDAAIARSGAEAVLPAHAHAALAEAFVLQRRGDSKALAAQLRRDRKLLLFGLDVRERALVRAMSRLLATPSTSVYRTPAGVEKAAFSGEEPPIAVWIARVAPDLVAFAPRPPPAAERRPAVDTEASRAAPPTGASRRADDAKGRDNAPIELRLAAFAQRLLLALVLLVVGLLAPVPSGPIPVHPWIALAAVGVPALLYAVVELTTKQRRAEIVEIQALSLKATCGEDVSEQLAAIASGEQDVPAAFAELIRASVADSRAQIATALAHAEAAKNKLRSESSRAAAGPYLLPAIITSRAYSLAALRRAEEAEAELAKLPADYLRLDRARFSVRLIAHVAEGDIEGAGRLVDATPPDLSIGPRDELIRDLVRAATSPGGAGVSELSRLREELRDDDEQRLWIERVAPKLLARFERATMVHNLRLPGVESSEDDAASQEALEDVLTQAELEALEAAQAPRIRARS